MNIPIDSPLEFTLITTNTATGVLSDALAVPTITVRQGTSVIAFPTTVTKIAGTVGTYAVTITVDAVRAIAGKNYSVIASYTVLNGVLGNLAVTRREMVFQAVNADFTSETAFIQRLLQTKVDGNMSIHFLLATLLAGQTGTTGFDAYDPATNNKVRRTYSQNGTLLITSTSHYAAPTTGGMDILTVVRTCNHTVTLPTPAPTS